jgi:hypothetical protein
MTLFGVNPDFCATDDAAGAGVAVAVSCAEVPAFAVPPDVSGAIFAKFDAFVPAAGAEAVADGANGCVDTGLLLKRMLALAAGEPVGVPTAVVLAGRAELVAGAAVLIAGAMAEGCEPFGPELVDGITDVIAAMALLTTECIADLTAAIVVGAATSDLAVVTQPAAGDCVPLQLVNDVAACTWQQPQSCDLAPWPGPCAPLVPWLV